MGETRGQVCFQGCAVCTVDGADISCHVERSSGWRNGDVEVADVVDMVRADGVVHGSRHREVVVRQVQQPVQDDNSSALVF